MLLLLNCQALSYDLTDFFVCVCLFFVKSVKLPEHMDEQIFAKSALSSWKGWPDLLFRTLIWGLGAWGSV